ncbi:alpha/beta fold hydrolase [Sphingobacterium sp. UT-1RO-CII-1]|uniref:alpha/beta hydrolase n=1 Tax=Sphingobacterium sp. UT-1RO-CII-1 TaxID=2995225 RepID=UPI00227BC5EC|nr:alpha/beta fold hydrolase [Sphingobacterium sp. UT-1RO-CII-1]MCY4778576.1 alpha/beta fold hydrolase [Sphingobacterium sp. UT-1RO-CII-1]
MKLNINKIVQALLLGITIAFVVACQCGKENRENGYITIEEQGSFAIGGTVITAPGNFDPIAHGAFNPSNQSSEGQTLHGDHAFVFYQRPVNARKLPLIFWHGYGQSMKTWQTTPDGREGFQDIFLRRQFSVYNLDQPRRGKAGRSTKPITLTATPDDQLWFGIFRLGVGTEFYPDVQFSKSPEALQQFFRQITPDTGPLDIDLNTEAVSELFNKIGQGILVTHSQSGGMGWLTALKNSKIQAIVSYEPMSNFVFPEGETPDPIAYLGGQLGAITVSITDFKKLTSIPIVMYYGDFIPDEPVDIPGQEQWRAAYQMAKKWADTINKHGGDATLVRLPEVGIKGNTHFPMSDLNNIEVADHMSAWLKKKGLDK